MEPKELTKLWSEPDNTRLTPRQFSIRLPLHVSAKISALCEMFPQRSRTQIIGDLLASALEQVAAGLSDKPYEGEEEELRDQGGPAYTLLGEIGRYYRLVEKYEKELEKEMGEGVTPRAASNENAPPTEEPAVTKRAPRQRGASAQTTTKARPAEALRAERDQPDRGSRRGRRPTKA